MAVRSPITQVKVTATHVVQCAEPQKIETLPSPFTLGPLDHFPFPYTVAPTDIVWVYEPTSVKVSADLVPVARLRTAISILLNYYPHLTGRLSIDPSNGLRTITRMGSGILLLEANCNAVLSTFRNAKTGELDMYDLPGSGSALIAPWEVSLEGMQRDPLFTFQHTRFQCGSVAIGMRIAHTICAAEGTLGIYQHLAEIYRKTGPDGIGEGVVLDEPPHIVPFMSDEMTDMSPEDRAAALAQTPIGFTTDPPPAPPGIEPQDPNPPTNPPPRVVGRTLYFPPTSLAAIKAAATPPSGSPTAWVSTFEALSAHLWRATHRARLLAYPPSTHPSSASLYTSINFALPHHNLPFPTPYFPNAILPGFTPPLSSDTLASGPLWVVAQAVHTFVRSTTAADAVHLAKWIAAQGDKDKVGHPFPWGSRWAFVTAAWDKYRLYTGAELGEEEKLVVAGPPFTEMSLFDGFATFVEARGGRGGVEVKFTVAEGVMGVLEREGWLGGEGEWK